MRALCLFVLTFFLMALLRSGPVSAEELPVAGRADPRIRSVVYNKDNVVAIDATFGTSTMIVLQEGEKIETLALGDSISWKIEPNHKGDIIFVKPVEKDAMSNLNVVTDKRTYSFILRSNMHPTQNQIYKVQFHYPDDEADSKLLAKAKELAAFPNQKQMNVANANYNYGYKGSQVNKPSVAFDDGSKTWFIFDGEIPAIYSVDGNRNENLVNYHREGAYTIVDKVNFQWTLRNGAEATCVFNRRLNSSNQPTGSEPNRPQIVGGPAK
jgi:P-type conjugative transfer protein VirB9